MEHLTQQVQSGVCALWNLVGTSTAIVIADDETRRTELHTKAMQGSDVIAALNHVGV
jgi:hypothetical protein